MHAEAAIPQEYSSFAEFIESAVLPLHEQEPERKRLNGREKGGDRTTWAIVRHGGLSYRVHADAEIAALIRPYRDVEYGRSASAVTPGLSKAGKTKLKPHDGHDKGFYVYLNR